MKQNFNTDATSLNSWLGAKTNVSFATNSDFLTFRSLQPKVVDLRYFKL